MSVPATPPYSASVAMIATPSGRSERGHAADVLVRADVVRRSGTVKSD